MPAELDDEEEPVPDAEDAPEEEAAANGCTTENARIEAATRRSHRGSLGSRSGRGGNADLLFDGTSDSMGG